MQDNESEREKTQKFRAFETPLWSNKNEIFYPQDTVDGKLNQSFFLSLQITVLNGGTIIQLTHSTSNSSKLRTRSDSNVTYIKRSPLKKQFQKRWSHCGEMRRKHANFCEYEYVCI